MGYLHEFQKRVQAKEADRTLQLWEEYLTCDEVDSDELIQILNLIKQSDLKASFGSKVESALPLWEAIKETPRGDEVLKLIFDIQMTNSARIKDLAWKLLEERYHNHPHFRDWQRICGLRMGVSEDHQGVLRKFELLEHIGKGQHVFHSGGWGTGEIVDVSFVREQLQIEFENVGGVKELSFANAFKVLVPLPKESFLARRFSDPDKFEKEAKKDSLGILKLLLRDLGPKTAQEIKDELIELVIPESDWAKWWQAARVRLKKDPMVESPKHLDEPFSLRDKAKKVEDHLNEVLVHQEDLDRLIPVLYAFLRDVPDALKQPGVSDKIKKVLIGALGSPDHSFKNKLQMTLFLDQYFDYSEPGSSVKDYMLKVEHPEALIDSITVLAFKKRILESIRKFRQDWPDLFMKVFSTSQPVIIRDYLFRELLQHVQPRVEEKITALMRYPQKDPETFLWYFQKLLTQEEIPYAHLEGRGLFLESLLTLLSSIENDPSQKDCVKRIYNLLTGDRYKVVRQIIEGTSKPFLQELILLASKCQTLTSHDQKVFTALAAVVQPSLSTKEVVQDRHNPNIFWITYESLEKAKEQIRHIGTVEMVEVAREIEAARALGDLRENSEYKFAQEKRRRLQGDLKRLSEQIQKARIITEEDVETEEIGVGNVVHLEDGQGSRTTFTILGPFDADPDKHILSSQSQIAQALIGKSVGDTVQYKNEELRIVFIGSFFHKSG